MTWGGRQSDRGSLPPPFYLHTTISYSGDRDVRPFFSSLASRYGEMGTSKPSCGCVSVHVGGKGEQVSIRLSLIRTTKEGGEETNDASREIPSLRLRPCPGAQTTSWPYPMDEEETRGNDRLDDQRKEIGAGRRPPFCSTNLSSFPKGEKEEKLVYIQYLMVIWRERLSLGAQREKPRGRESCNAV